MKESVKILIVEDDMIIAAKISMQLGNLGYEVTGIVPKGEQVLVNIASNKPDIVLLDINLRGTLDGIETAHQIQAVEDIPIIYVTANTDEETFNRAKATRPYAFIPKPIKNLDLQRAIELTISRMAEQNNTDEIEITDEVAQNTFVLKDRIFVKNGGKMTKIFNADILYIEADRNYCQIYTKDKNITLTITLKALEEKLPSPMFVRIHRSYIVNISQIEEVSEANIVISKKLLPLSQTYRDDLLKHIQTI